MSQLSTPIHSHLNPENFPSIKIDTQQLEWEKSYYGSFRCIVKQNYFGIKLEEGPFTEFSNQNPVNPIHK